MANDRHRWLDEEAAERLLCGTPSGVRPGERAAAPAYREPVLAGRIAAALDALAPPVKPGEGQRLAGEEAAVAAFRLAHGHPAPLRGEGLAERPRPEQPLPVGEAARPRQSARTASGPPAAAAHSGAPVASAASRRDRYGRPERVDRPLEPGGPTRSRTSRFPALGRPLRTGFALAVVGCALGGVAVATGGGLPTFGGGGGGGSAPTPSTSASSPASSDSFGAPSPEAPPGGPRWPGATAPPSATPDGSPSATQGTAGPHRDGAPGPDGDRVGARDTVRELCRTYQAGGLAPADRLPLERAAGGAGLVTAFCGSLVRERDGGQPGADAPEPVEDPGQEPGDDGDDGDGGTESPEPSQEPGEPSGRPSDRPSPSPSDGQGGTRPAPPQSGGGQPASADAGAPDGYPASAGSEPAEASGPSQPSTSFGSEPSESSEPADPSGTPADRDTTPEDEPGAGALDAGGTAG